MGKITQSRRSYLALAGVTGFAGLAGCADIFGGDTDDGGESDGGEGGDAETTVADLCGQIPADNVAYQAGDTPLLCDFDIPATFEPAFGPLTGDGGGGLTHRGLLRSDASSYGELTLEVRQTAEEGMVSRGMPPSEPDRDSAFVVEFNHQEIPFYERPTQETIADDETVSVSVLTATLQYTVDSTPLFFPITVRTELDVAESIPEDCVAAMAEVTRGTAESIRLNEQTTIDRWVRENWDEPPE